MAAQNITDKPLGKLNPTFKQAWLKALRSAEYNQGRYRLKTLNEDGTACHCCLGVALENEPEVTQRKRRGEPSVILFDAPGNETMEGHPTLAIRKRWGMTRPAMDRLINMNDAEYKSFKQIADWVERTL